mgnify:FL=1
MSNMLTLSGMQDDGAPTPIKQRERGESNLGEDGEPMVSLKQSVLDDMVEERTALYDEMDKLKVSERSERALMKTRAMDPPK